MRHKVAAPAPPGKGRIGRLRRVSDPDQPGVHRSWASAPRWVRVLVAGLPALAAAAPLVSAAGRVPMFRDERATAQLSALPLGDLWRATAYVDRVLLPHLLLTKLWAALAGGSALALRAPCIVAAIGSVVVLAVLAGRLAGPVGGAVGAAVLAVAPLTSTLAVFARPYAGATLLALLALLSLHHAVTSGGRAWWVAHASLITASLLLQPFAALALPAHLALAHATPGRHRWRALARGWAVATGAALLVAVGAVGQQGQVGWIPVVGARAAAAVLERALSSPVAWLAAVGALTGGVLVAVRRRVPWWWVGVALLVAPPLALWVASAVLEPTFVERYLFIVPAGAALLVGGPAGALADVLAGRERALGVRRRRRPLAVLLLGVAVAVGVVLPARVDVRPVGGQPQARQWSPDPASPVAAAVAAALQPGDLLVIEQRRGWGGYAADLAHAWGDDGFSQALDRRAVSGDLTDVVRSVSATAPPVTSQAPPSGGGPRRVVLLSLRATAADRFVAASGAGCARGPESRDPRLSDSHLWVLRCASTPGRTSLSRSADDPVR